MQVLITGGGQLARTLVATAPAGFGVTAPGRGDLDITDVRAVARAMTRARPDLVINAAAYTRVDQAEDEPALAFAVNATAAGSVAREATRQGARVVQISTDFVFDGRRGSPYPPDAPAAPLNVYGRSKLEGERVVAEASAGNALIIRTAWLYAAEGRNFVTTMVRLLQERDCLRIVTDQVGTPTAATSLAGAIWAASAKPGLSGVHHWTDAGVASWFDFAIAIGNAAVLAGLVSKQVPIVPISSAEFPARAIRPAFSVLDTGATIAALGIAPRHWSEPLRETIAAMAGSSAVNVGTNRSSSA